MHQIPRLFGLRHISIRLPEQTGHVLDEHRDAFIWFLDAYFQNALCTVLAVGSAEGVAHFPTEVVLSL